MSSPATTNTQATTRAAFQRTTTRPRHGCAWFIWPVDAPDKDPQHAGGWMAIDGQPATWFNSPRDLPPDVVWWTNLEPAAAWSMGRSSHIKSDGFLGLDWFALLSRWGRPVGPDATREAVSLWSELLARLSYRLDQWCAQQHVLDHPMADPSQLPSPDWSWGEGDFVEALARRLGVPVSGGPAGISSDSPPGLEEAWQVQIHADLPGHLTEGRRRLALLLPPAAHAAHVRSSRVPKGPWRELPPGQWPIQDDRRWAWLEENQSQPLLVRFDHPPQAHPGQEELLRLAWGRRGRRFPGAPYEPVWMPGEEALGLRECLVGAPSVIWIAAGWEQGPSLPWPTVDPQDALEGCSLLSAILEGAFWRAWATPLRNDRRLRPTPSTLSVWWRSADRQACLEAARHCQEGGLDVIAYGNGQVHVVFSPDRTLSDWERPLAAANVLVPRDLAAVARVPTPPVLNAKAVDAWLLVTSQPLEAWFSLDRMLSPWLGDDRRHLKEMMSSTLAALTQIPPPSGASADWGAKWRALLLERSRSALARLLPGRS